MNFIEVCFWRIDDWWWLLFDDFFYFYVVGVNEEEVSGDVGYVGRRF